MRRAATKTDFSFYNTKGTLELAARMAQVKAILFRNSGQAVILIGSSFRLAPGQTLSINQYDGSIDQSDYNYIFLPNDPLSTGVTQRMDVVTTVYSE